MLKRLASLTGARRPAAQRVERDAYLEAAAVALEVCLAGSARIPVEDSEEKPEESSLRAALGGDSFAQALRLLLSAPVSKEREALVNGEVRQLLRNALLIPGCVFLEDDLLNLLRSLHVEESLSDILANALCSALTAFARDEALESRANAAASTAVSAASTAPATGAGASIYGSAQRRERLRVCQEVAREASSLESGWVTSMRTRQELVQKSQELLAVEQRRVLQRFQDASDRKAKSQQDYEALIARSVSPSTAPTDHTNTSDGSKEDAVLLERKLVSLEERKQQLRGELDSLSQKIAEQQALQREHIEQEQQRTRDLQEARGTASRRQFEAVKQTTAMDMKQAECSTFLDTVQKLQDGIMQELASSDTEDQALLRDARSEENDCQAGQVASANSRLQACAATAERWLSENERAAKMMDIIGVEVREEEMPLRKELPTIVKSLKLAFEIRQSLGEMERKEEMTMLLDKMEDALGEANSPPLTSSSAPQQAVAANSHDRSFAFEPSGRASAQEFQASVSLDSMATASPTRNRPVLEAIDDALEASSPLCSPSTTSFPPSQSGFALEASSPLCSPSAKSFPTASVDP